MKNHILWLFVLLLTGLGITGNKVKAQDNWNYIKEAVVERKVVPYPFIREADVMYMRRVHRVIDTREKMNIILRWPRNPLFNILYTAATSGYGGPPIKAYSKDSLNTTLTPEEILNKGGEEEIIQVPYDPEDPESETYDSSVVSPLNIDKLVRLEIMEEWIFDKQTSQFFCRIIAIAPLFKWKISGIELPEQQLFWLKWEDLRPILVNQELFNRHNDAQRYSYLDFFEERFFSSYIVKESNAYDYYIKEFEEFKSDPFAALLESEKIKGKLAEWEHNLWEW